MRSIVNTWKYAYTTMIYTTMHAHQIIYQSLQNKILKKLSRCNNISDLCVYYRLNVKHLIKFVSKSLPQGCTLSPITIVNVAFYQKFQELEEDMRQRHIEEMCNL